MLSQGHNLHATFRNLLWPIDCCSFAERPGRRAFQPILWIDPGYFLWSHPPVPNYDQVLEELALSNKSLYSYTVSHGKHRTLHLVSCHPYVHVFSPIQVSTELTGLIITCKSDEFAIFNPPSGQTCSQWAQDFISAAGGYLDNGDATSDCRYCQYRKGDEFFLPLNMRFENRWRDACLLLVFFGEYKELLFQLTLTKNTL